MCRICVHSPVDFKLMNYLSNCSFSIFNHPFYPGMFDKFALARIFLKVKSKVECGFQKIFFTMNFMNHYFCPFQSISDYLGILSRRYYRFIINL